MRISCEIGDPGWHNYRNPQNGFFGCRIFLDGEEVKQVLTADEEDGYLKVADGFCPYGTAKYKDVYGKVEIRKAGEFASDSIRQEWESPADALRDESGFDMSAMTVEAADEAPHTIDNLLAENEELREELACYKGLNDKAWAEIESLRADLAALLAMREVAQNALDHVPRQVGPDAWTAQAGGMVFWGNLAYVEQGVRDALASQQPPLASTTERADGIKKAKPAISGIGIGPTDQKYRGLGYCAE